MRAALLLLALSFVAFLPFLGYPEWRGTEARRVQIAAEMVGTGDLIVPRLWGEETFAKPPLYYWALAGGIRAFGLEPLVVRLPSVLSFWLLAVLALHFLTKWFDRRTAWIGAVGMLVSPVVMHDVPFAEIDPVFSALTVASLLFLSDGVFERRALPLVIAGLLGGAAVMTKGPPYLMFFLGPLVIWWKQARLRGIWWWLPFVFLFWVAYKLALDAVGPGTDEASEVAVAETVGRMAFWEPRALKGIPAHLLGSPLALSLPLTAWLVPWWRGTRRAADPASRRANFLVWAALGSIVVLCFSVDRSTRYQIPAVPLLLFGLSPLVARSFATDGPPPEWVRRALLGFGLLFALAACAVPFLPHPYPGTTGVAVLALAAIGWFAHSQRQLVKFALVVPLIIAWFAFPDRVVYKETKQEFAPACARVVARELEQRGVDRVHLFGHVGTAILLHTLELMDRRPRLSSDWMHRRDLEGPWLFVVDRGTRRDYDVETPGYATVLRVQMEKKSLSLRKKF